MPPLAELKFGRLTRSWTVRRNDAMKAHFQPVADDCMVSMGWEVKVPIREVKARTSPAPCKRKRAARPA